MSVRFWIAAGLISTVAHVSAATWIRDHEARTERAVRPRVEMEIVAVPPSPPPPVRRIETPPVEPPKHPVRVRKLVAKVVPPAQEVPPPAAPKIGITEDATTARGEVEVATGVSTEGEIGTGEGTDKTAPPAPALVTPPGPQKHYVPSFRVTRLPVPRHAVQPEIPDAFRDAQREVLVVVEVEIDEQGHVQNARILRHGEFGLDDAALAAARATDFEPALVGNQAVAVRYQIPYRFKVKG